MSTAFSLPAVLISLVVVSPVVAQTPAEKAYRAKVQEVRSTTAYTDDAFVFTGQSSRPFSGGRRLPSGGLKQEEKIDTIVVSKSRDLAYAYGTAKVSWEGQEPFDAAFLKVYRKDGDEWKIAAMLQRPLGEVTVPKVRVRPN